MRRSRVFTVLVLAILLWCQLLPLSTSAQQPARQFYAAGVGAELGRTSIWPPGLDNVPTVSGTPALNRSGKNGAERNSIREDISDRYKDRYLAWKTEFLSTEVGRAQWDEFAH